MNTDKILVDRAKKGDMTAFEEIVTTYEARVYALALRSTGIAADAADLTQEVFLRAWRSLSSFRGDSSLSTWLYRITNNLCVDRARRNAHTPQVSIEDEETGDGRIADDTVQHQPEEAFLQGEIQREITYVLGLLSEEHRSIVILRDVDGYSYAEMSQILNLEEGTVKSRLARARTRLRELLIERGNLSLPSASKVQERRTEHV